MLRVQIKVEQQTERGTRQLSHSASSTFAVEDLDGHSQQVQLQQQLAATLTKAKETLTKEPVPSVHIDKDAAANLREYARLIEAGRFVISVTKNTDQNGKHYVQLTLDPTK